MPRSTQERRELRRQVGHALRSLGETEAGVARRLEAAGVRGSPGDISDCALAVYLSAVVGADPRVRAVWVGTERVLIKLDRRWRLPVAVTLPKQARRFVAQFDQRRFPALVRRRTGTGCSRDRIPG